jgi:uncharacterized protein YecE (DUF72 family)
MIFIGTAGFSYRDWVGPFYPKGMPQREWLGHYAREFPTLELNVTFYRLPDARTLTGWIERTPPGFLFSVKAFRGLTHEREAPDFSAFVAAVRPLAESGKLACVLAQFPQSFRRTPANEAYLAQLRSGLEGLPLVVEFRHVEWVDDNAFERLRQLKLGFACVDEPRLKGLMPPVAVATGPLAYVRFHGRNAKQWYRHDAAWQRYDYRYKAEELREWLPRLRQLDAEAEQTLVYFNNNPRGQGIEDARALKKLLEDRTRDWKMVIGNS